MNIIKVIQNQIEKGNTMIDRNGNMVREESGTAFRKFKKRYLAGLESGEIAMNVSFDDYYKGIQKSEYVSALEMLTILGDYGFIIKEAKPETSGGDLE